MNLADQHIDIPFRVDLVRDDLVSLSAGVAAAAICAP